MEKGRLEAFSDGVIAIIITIMVLELKVPHGDDLAALQPVLPVFVSYLLSFVYVGIYWNNHHHMLQATKDVGGAVLWANMHLLFWLSLVPFVTGWMGENHDSAAPVGLYGFVLLLSAVAYWILQRSLMARPANREVLTAAFGRDLKGKSSPVFYLIAILAACWHPWISKALYIGVACMWLVPDPRIETVLSGKEP